MTKRERINLLVFLILTSIYSIVFIVMFFFPWLHEIHSAFLMLGAILIVGFVLMYGLRGRAPWILPITLVVFMTLLVQIAIEYLGDIWTFLQNDVFHLIVHIISGIAYFIFALMMVVEFTRHKRDFHLKNVSFDYNETIVFEYILRTKTINLQVSNVLKKIWQLDSTKITTDSATFLEWIAPEDQPLFQWLTTEGHPLPSFNKIVHLRINEFAHPITVQIKSAYKFGDRIMLLGVDHTNIDKLETSISDESSHRLQLIDNMPLGLVEHEMIYNPEGVAIDYKYIYANDAFCEMVKWKREDFINQAVSIISPSYHSIRLAQYQKLFMNTPLVEFEAYFEAIDIWYQVRAYRSGDHHFISLFQDVTALKKANDALKKISLFNPINGLPNLYSLEQAILRLKDVKDATCFYMTIANFEEIETFYGHRFTQQLIKRIASEFASYQKRNHLVANTNHTHFILLLINPSSEETNETIKFATQSVYSRYRIDNTEISLRENIGYAMLNEATDDLLGLITQARIACNEAAKTEHNVIVKYKKDYEKLLDDNVQMADKLSRAIEQNLIEIYYQKIVDTRTGEAAYLEALARWNDQELGVIPPDRFLDLAASSSLIDVLDNYLLERTLATFSQLKSGPFKEAILNLNVSPSAIHREGFDLLLINTTLKYGLYPNQICIEISENTFIKNTSQSILMIRKLKLYGFKIAIDDFGSQYSSFGILDLIPYDILKLDGLFSLKLKQSSISMMVKTLVDICAKDDRVLIVEKVETKTVADQFVTLGCPLQQGYYHHKPEKLTKIKLS